MADVLTALASLYVSQDRAPAAEKLLLRALAIRERSEGRESAAYAHVQRQLAAVFRLQNRNTEAERVEKSLERRSADTLDFAVPFGRGTPRRRTSVALRFRLVPSCSIVVPPNATRPSTGR